ncbi:MAG TPA: AMP-binding protein [Thermoanaerobaculia bacterium]|nr:AMP-binding protein [Thermoanaerobaculia bacterium]
MNDLTLAAILARRAAAHPDKLAFADGGRRLTYAQLDEDANALASGLAERGARPGDRIVLVLPAGLDFIRCFWAIQRLGAVSCAVNPATPLQTITARAARVRPKLVINGVGDIPRGAAALPPLPSDPEALAFLQPTSGTSGESRTVMIRQRNVLAVLQASEEALQVGEQDVLVSWVPPWHDLGLVRFVIGTVYAGASCHIVLPAIGTIPRWLSTVTEVRGTITGAPDFAWRLAARLVEPGAVDLSSLRYASNGGEPVRLSTVEAFEERFGIRGVLCPAYGLAEATLGVTTVLPGEPLLTDEHGNVSCGRPFPRVEVRIDGDETGEILVRGPGVFENYFDAPDAAVVRDGWLHTGDVGRLDATGGLYVLGRRRAMLKRGGAVLAPRELEEAAQGVEGVRLAAAVGIARPDLVSEEIVLAVEIDRSDRAAAQEVADAVADAVRRTIGFAPERVIVLAPRTIPRTYNGKIRHDVLRTELTEGVLAGRGAVVFSSY